jgi:hypothetical protein
VVLVVVEGHPVSGSLYGLVMRQNGHVAKPTRA